MRKILDAGNLAAARAAFAALKPGGKFLIEVMNKSWVLSQFWRHSDGVVEGVRIVQRNRWRAKTGKLSTTWTFSKGRKVENYRVLMRIYDGAEMRVLLRAAGFRDIQLFGHPPVGRFTRHSRRFIAVAKRPAK